MENENPEQSTCQCGTDYNRFCSLCTPWRMDKVQQKQAKLRKSQPRMVKEVPPVKSNKMDMKRFHKAKLLLQKALGRRLTNQQFRDYIAVRGEALRKKREEVATYGPEGKPQATADIKEVPVENRIQSAITQTLKEKK